MTLTDEIRKLAELHQEGHLTDQEFADAKRKLISENRPDSPGSQREEQTTSSAMTRIAEKCFQSSRWSASNLFFPDRLTLASDGILFRKGALFGSARSTLIISPYPHFGSKTAYSWPLSASKPPAAVSLFS